MAGWVDVCPFNESAFTVKTLYLKGKHAMQFDNPNMHFTNPCQTVIPQVFDETHHLFALLVLLRVDALITQFVTVARVVAVKCAITSPLTSAILADERRLRWDERFLWVCKRYAAFALMGYI